jgi:hypothetical protein
MPFCYTGSGGQPKKGVKQILCKTGQTEGVGLNIHRKNLSI